VRVFAVEPLSPDMVAAQIDACIDDIGVDAVKIGMLGSAAIAHVVADRLEKIDAPVVFDPVMVATSGGVLADVETVAAFDRLMALATLTTPNLPELEAWAGRSAVRGKTKALLIREAHGGAVIENRLHTPMASTYPPATVSTPATPMAPAARWPARLPPGWGKG
jgi:hydroxymethylpyrimidine/phosphomethylpyrimidine kinase